MRVPGTMIFYHVEAKGFTGRWVRMPHVDITADVAEAEAMRVARVMATPTRIVCETVTVGSTRAFDHSVSEVIAEYA
jgi:hypothetical protein